MRKLDEDAKKYKAALLKGKGGKNGFMVFVFGLMQENSFFFITSIVQQSG
jgi:hypothetical protein